MEKILVVEDVDGLRDQLKWGLGTEYMILEGADRHRAMELFLSHAPKVVILDLGLPPEPDGTAEGVRCLECMMEARPGTKVVVVTGTEDPETARRALSYGAYEYCHKPVDLDHLKVVVRRALQLSDAEARSQRLEEIVAKSSASIAGIVGQFSAMQELLTPLRQPGSGAAHEASGDAPVGRWPEQIDAASVAYCAPFEQKGAGQAWAQPEGQAKAPRGGSTLREARDMVEKGMISNTIATCGGNLAKAAEMLGVSRPALYDLLKKHGLFKGGQHRG